MKDDMTPYKISNTESFNKIQTAISTAAFPFIYYLIKDNKGSVIGLKISLGLFVFSIFLTMLALIITCDYPEQKGCLRKFIDIIDWTSFAVFSLALFLICIAVLAI